MWQGISVIYVTIIQFVNTHKDRNMLLSVFLGIKITLDCNTHENVNMQMGKTQHRLFHTDYWFVKNMVMNCESIILFAATKIWAWDAEGGAHQR